MNHSLGIAIESLVAVLLMLTIGYCMLLNNRLVYEGDIVNRSLGVTFESLDAVNQLLIFRDSTGAVVTRSY